MTVEPKALYLIDSNNEIVEEFSSTVEASSMLFIDRRHIARGAIIDV